MILLYGSLNDPPLARTLAAVQDAGADYVLLAQSALDREDLHLEAGSSGVDGVLRSAGRAVPLSEFHSIFARPLEPPASAFAAADLPRVHRFHGLLMEWLDVVSALVVNRPCAMQSNASKPLQAQIIGAAGFLVPETLITSDEAEVRDFWRQHGRIVFKSISGIRSIVQELDEGHAAKLHRLKALPAQFQAYVPGVDVRAHVVGRRVFAAQIRSSAIDYRYPSAKEHTARPQRVDLPPEVMQRCVCLAGRMDLPLAGIDLRRRPDGEYVCFEVNPMPAYTYFEVDDGPRINEALAELLSEGRDSSEVISCKPSKT